MTGSQESAAITILAERAREGDERAKGELFVAAYGELRRLAAYHLRGERAGHTLQPTALVNEAYLKLFGISGPEVKDRKHFYAVASQAMRRLLVDYARARNTAKRGGGTVPLDAVSAVLAQPVEAGDVVSLDDALNSLQKKDPRARQVVEMKYFAGLREDQIAEALGVSRRTVARDWDFAKEWISGAIRQSGRHHR